MILQSQHVHSRLMLKEQKIFTFKETHAQKAHATTSKDTYQWLGLPSSYPSSTNWKSFTPMLSVTHIYQKNSKSPTIQQSSSFQVSTMDALQYWPFVHEYSIWNATVSALQFWIADLEPHILSNAIHQVYTAFFYSDYTQQIQNVPEDTVFGHYVTTLNDAFETELEQEDKGYDSGSESFNIPTPLSRAPHIYHVSTREDLSFNAANFGQSPTTPEQH